jgi:DNA replication initiation complex subunit (GINS family)
VRLGGAKSTTPHLGGLPQDFYVRIAEYQRRINEDHSALDKKSVKVGLLEKEAKNVQRMLSELLDMRYRKIVKTVTKLHKVPVELLASEEAKMCQTFVGFANAYQQFAKNLMEGQEAPITVTIVQASPAVSATIEEKPKVEAKPTVVHVTHKRLTLRFNKAIPAIMGADMKSYGPFAAEDVASLPALNAQILIKQGLAVLVDSA